MVYVDTVIRTEAWPGFFHIIKVIFSPLYQPCPTKQALKNIYYSIYTVLWAELLLAQTRSLATQVSTISPEFYCNPPQSVQSGGSINCQLETFQVPRNRDPMMDSGTYDLQLIEWAEAQLPIILSINIYNI